MRAQNPLAVKILSGAILITFGVIFALDPSCRVWQSPNRVADRQSQEDLKQGWFFATQYVRDHLKAPASAKFEALPPEGAIKNIGAHRWEMSGSVDSQNSFGALIRSSWKVTAEFRSGSWQISDLDLTTP